MIEDVQDVVDCAGDGGLGRVKQLGKQELDKVFSQLEQVYFYVGVRSRA